MWMPISNGSTTDIVELAMDGSTMSFAAPNNIEVADIAYAPDGNLGTMPVRDVHRRNMVA
jgi:hypothetical protein